MSWIFLVLILIVIVIGIWLFNGLVKARNLVEAAWADIDVQLQRRHDLVPRLVNIVRGYAGHERETLEAVVERRDQALRARTVGEKSEVEKDLDRALQRLVVLVEDYPELKAGENFSQLQSDLVEIEDYLQYARRFYNGAVRDYNTRVERFPDQIVARALDFNQADFFQAEAGSRATATVDMGGRS